MSKSKIDKIDRYEQLKSQLLAIQEYIEKVDEINPDIEMYLQGRDIYVMHVGQVVDEILELCERIDSGKAPTYNKEWVAQQLAQDKENYGD